MKTLHLKPRAGLTVRHEDGRALQPAGERVADSRYWRRRLAAGDVVPVRPKRKKAPAKAAAPAAPLDKE